MKTWGFNITFPVIKSLLLHTGLAIFILGAGKSLLDSHFKAKPEIKFLKSAVRIDIVAMPKLTLKELKAMRPTIPKVEKVIEEVSAKTAPVVENKGPELKVKAKKKSFADLIKDLNNRKVSKKGSTAKKLKKKNSKPIFSNKELNSLINAGNKTSKGVALTGDSAEVKGQLAQYGSLIEDSVHSFWKLPSYLIDKGLTCHIQIFLSRDGDLLKYKIIKPSGEAEFDERAVSAITSAAPFPAAPSVIVSKLVSGEIVLAFPIF